MHDVSYQKFSGKTGKICDVKGSLSCTRYITCLFNRHFVPYGYHIVDQTGYIAIKAGDCLVVEGCV